MFLPLSQRINNLYDDIWSTTNAVQETWRFVVIIVLFVLAILFTLGLMALVSRMRFPKTTSLVTSFYWLMVALLMLGGTGTREKKGGGEYTCVCLGFRGWAGVSTSAWPGPVHMPPLRQPDSPGALPSLLPPPHPHSAPAGCV